MLNTQLQTLNTPSYSELSYLFSIGCRDFFWKVDSRCDCREESEETREVGPFLTAKNPPDSPPSGLLIVKV